MELYPAVDIEGGRVARAHGAMAEPIAALQAFTRAGARWIHLVDMDRAYGRQDNHGLIGAVLNAATVNVQVGGGLFREIDIDQMFTLGATRVVIGPRGAVDSGLSVAEGDDRHPLAERREAEVGRADDRLSDGLQVGGGQRRLDESVRAEHDLELPQIGVGNAVEIHPRERHGRVTLHVPCEIAVQDIDDVVAG